ncbi:MAG: AzlC family ABC transporter permease [Chloroflexi bacterium]|nr:AzlC family ABC transporter permease [Chloroflexota bacterium]
MPPKSTAIREFSSGAKDTIPMMIGAAPFGIIFGALAISGERALTPSAAMGMSLIVFAGSAQFIALGLYAQGIGLPFIVFTTFIVNLRHALYAASLAPFMRHLGQRWLAPLGFMLTDETYAVVIRRFHAEGQTPRGQWYYLGSALPFYCNWQLCTLVGIVAGSQLGDAAAWGLEFAMTVTFIGIVVPLVKSRPMLACALVAAAASLATASLPNRLGLLVGGLAGIAVGLLIEWAESTRHKRRQLS